MHENARELIADQQREIHRLNTYIEAQMITMYHLRRQNELLRQYSPSIAKVRGEHFATLKRLTESQMEISRLTRTIKSMEREICLQKTEYERKLEYLTSSCYSAKVFQQTDNCNADSLSVPSFLSPDSQRSRELKSEELKCSSGLHYDAPGVILGETNVLPEFSQISNSLAAVPEFLVQRYKRLNVCDAIEQALAQFCGKKQIDMLALHFDQAAEKNLKLHLQRALGIQNKRRIGLSQKLYETDDQDPIELVFAMCIAFFLINGAERHGSSFTLGEDYFQL